MAGCHLCFGRLGWFRLVDVYKLHRIKNPFGWSSPQYRICYSADSHIDSCVWWFEFLSLVMSLQSSCLLLFLQLLSLYSLLLLLCILLILAYLSIVILLTWWGGTMSSRRLHPSCVWRTSYSEGGSLVIASMSECEEAIIVIMSTLIVTLVTAIMLLKYFVFHQSYCMTLNHLYNILYQRLI
jgi:hypothetical protein